MKSPLKVWILAIALCALAPAVNADTFMFVPGIAGDATDTVHKGWIRVSDFNWGVAMPVTVTRSDGGGMTIGRATGDPIKLTIATGPWSREFLNNLPRGVAFPQVVIDHVNPDGRPAYRITFGNFVITRYSSAPTSKSPAQDEIEGVVGSYKAEFFAFSPDGQFKTTTTGWNYATNTGSP